MKDTANETTAYKDRKSATSLTKLGMFSKDIPASNEDLQSLLSCRTDYSFIQALKGNLPLLKKALFSPEAQPKFTWANLSLLIRDDPSITDTILSLNPPCLEQDAIRENLESLQRYETLVAPFSDTPRS